MTHAARGGELISAAGGPAAADAAESGGVAGTGFRGGSGFEAVLLDADGLLQFAVPGWEIQVQSFDPDDPDGIIAHLWEAEVPALRGEATLRACIEGMLAERGLDLARAADFVAMWDNIAPDRHAWQLVRDIRRAGVPTHLATNQTVFRRDLMLQLGYAELVDISFYSCDLGAAKPETAYFRRILERIDVPPARVLFVDDTPDNVAAAARVGIDAQLHDPATGAGGLRRLLRAAGIPGA